MLVLENNHSLVLLLLFSQLKHVCNDLQLPVFGALLKNLMKRCDEDKNEKVWYAKLHLLSYLKIIKKQ